jgi:hypothetical protein
MAVTRGLWQGELFGLMRTEVDLEARTLRVERQLERRPDGEGLQSHAQLFHYPTRCYVLGLTGGDNPMQVQRFKAMPEQCHSGFRSIPSAVIGEIEDPANFIGLRGKPRMKQLVPDEQIGCFEEDNNEARLFAAIFGERRLGWFGGKWPFRDLQHYGGVGRLIVNGSP